MAIYYDEWQKYSDVVLDYGGSVPPEADIVFAGYTYEDYAGSAIVVFMREGKLFENNDSHCSCFGLEAWEPEETSREALIMREEWPGLHEAITNNAG